MEIETASTHFSPMFLDSAGLPAGTIARPSFDATIDVRDSGEAGVFGVFGWQKRGWRMQFLSNGAENDVFHVDIEAIEQVIPRFARLGSLPATSLRPVWMYRKYCELTCTMGLATGGANGIVGALDGWADTVTKVNTAYGNYLDGKTGQSVQVFSANDMPAEASLVDFDNHYQFRLRPHTYGGSVTLVQVLMSFDT